QSSPRGHRRPPPPLPPPRRFPRARGGAALPERGSRDARLRRPRRVAQPDGARAAPRRGSANAVLAQRRRRAAAAGRTAELGRIPYLALAGVVAGPRRDRARTRSSAAGRLRPRLSGPALQDEVARLVEAY